MPNAGELAPSESGNARKQPPTGSMTCRTGARLGNILVKGKRKTLPATGKVTHVTVSLG